MPQVSPQRPRRRGLVRKAPVVHESSDEEQSQIPATKEGALDDDVYSPAIPSAAKGRPRRQQRLVEPVVSPSADKETNVGNVNESAAPDPQQIDVVVKQEDPDGSLDVQPKLKDDDDHMDKIAVKSTPLADITDAAVNSTNGGDHHPSVHREAQRGASMKPMEKPMDIVIRTRTKTQLTEPEPVGPKSRMVITYLVLNNFKSYAGRQEVGPFHASFSSVVGPNGSGKSNVIDSLLFVFGFRASKMRQGKISSLIHSSAHFPDLDHCEVEVHFQQVIDHPSGTKEMVPDSALIVSRKAFKNNSSKYYINGKEFNFTTVTTLLRDHGIDLDHKRFLILQGEVESIAQMKPKAANDHDDGLLEYLEDIIGTSKYKTPIEESAAETDMLNEVCHEKDNRVQHVDKEKKGLESKKSAAINFVKDENDLTIKQSALWQIYVNDCEDNIQIANESVGQLQGQLNSETERHNQGQEEIRQLEKRHAAETKQFQHMEQSTQSMVKQLAKADKETVKLEEKRKHLNTKLKKLEKTQAASDASIAEANSELQRLTEDLERNREAVQTIEKNLAQEDATLNTIRENLTEKTQGISGEISAKQKLLEPWLKQINEKKSAIAVAQSEVQMLRDREDSESQAITDIRSRLDRLVKERNEKSTNLEACKSDRKALDGQIKDLEQRSHEVNLQEPYARSKVSNARQRADEARASLASSQNQGNVLTSLMRLKETGRIEGFHGRLGSLGTIDQKYDVAISTACPALDNLVVDSVEVGQRCIEFLRKNNLGRANFILLDRLADRGLDPIQTPEDARRLFDLVKPKEEKFRQAFYSVLQNTLVAQDLEQANRVAYGAKRWRVVTLNGQLIDKSGTMSGGGTRTARGAMSSKILNDVSKEQVAKLERDRDTEEDSLRDIQIKQEEIARAMKEMKDKLPSTDTMIQKHQLELESFDTNIADAERRVAELTSEQQPKNTERKRISSLESDIAKLQGEISSLQTNTVGIEEDIQGLNEKIMEIGGVKLRGQKAKVDGLKERLQTLQEEISGEEVSLTKTEKDHIKQEKAEADASTNIASVQDEINKLDEDSGAQCRDLSDSRKQAEEAQEALESRKEELLALKSDLDQKTAEISNMRGAEIEIRNSLEESQKVLNENTKRLTYWQEKIGKLIIQNISDLDENLEPQSMPSYTRDELLDLDKNVLKGEIAALEEKTQNANVDMGVIGEYRRRVEEYASRSSDLTEAVGQRDAAKRRCEELRRVRLEGFMEGFSTISLRLKEMYQMITMGGNAELELVDSLDPFSEGILFSVMPPKKSWKNISNLSGGEKTLSSLALVFALHHYKPTPLYVMDEIDAALDFRNVSIVASYIKERTKNAQFIVISLRNNMFELASRLVGVYKVNHMTKSVTVENQDYIDRT